jgi:hypothetical protein
MIPFKEQVYAQFLQIAEQKVAVLQQQLDTLQESIALETKSTAGDKYETARAMIHQEQDRCNRHLAEALAVLAVMQHLGPLPPGSEQVIKGSLVHTDKGYFLICAGLGKALIEGETCYALSPQSPLGTALMGCRQGDSISLQGKEYYIASIS